MYYCCTSCNSACLSATQTFLCKLHSGAQQITTDIFHIIRLQGGWGHVPADELHCCVRWQFRRQWGGREYCVSCLLSLPEIQTGPTAAQAGSRRILDLSWSPTGAALKLPWSCSLGLNVDPPLVDAFGTVLSLTFCYIHSQFVSITTLKFEKWSQQLKPVLQTSRKELALLWIPQPVAAVSVALPLSFSHLCLVQDSIIHRMGD